MVSNAGTEQTAGVGSRGIVSAPLTPLSHDGSVDATRFAANVARALEDGPLAIALLAVEVQEYQGLSGDERVEAVRRGVEVVRAQEQTRPVVAGVSHPNVARALGLAERMAEAGADAVLALASRKPWGADPTPAETLAWYRLLADGSPLPVVVYINQRVGPDVPVAVVAEVCAHPNVIAIKETSRASDRLLGLCNEVAGPGHAAVYTNMESLLVTLGAGGHGAMMPPPGVPLAQGIVSAHLAGDAQAANELQAVFGTFPRRWMRLGLGPAIRAAEIALGRDPGPIASPFVDLDAAEIDALGQLLTTWSGRLR
jgi:4-hydroxy-tetrahydrodipicolinate synthase